MLKVMADIDAEGHLTVLLRIWESEAWSEVWRFLGVKIVTFPKVGLEPNATDECVWQVWQSNEIVWITNNRNQDSPTSLESTIRANNDTHSVPVITLADGPRLLTEPTYAVKAAEKILNILFDLESFRGSGRLFAP